MTPEQCLEARRLLGWSRERLEGLSELPQSFVRIYEKTGWASAGPAQSGAERVAAVRRVLEGAGADFTSGSETGVKLRRADL